MYRLSVSSAKHDYEVVFTEDLGGALQEQLQKDDCIIIDRKVSALYRDSLASLLSDARYIEIDACEEQKSYVTLAPVIEEVIKKGFRKNNRLIAIGGGITQDITAFTASILYRGVEWIFFPTTLLAQADSCIGGKTSINFNEYKNQLGNFYPPDRIFILTSLLKTLPAIDLRSGIGEMCHFFLVSGEVDFAFMQDNYPKALEDDSALEGLIKRCLEIKKGFIEIDEFDKRERQLLNYGHSFGHAIESLTHYRIPHGIAVSYGMDMANFISVKLGYIKEDIRLQIRGFLTKIWTGITLDGLDLSDFKAALLRDKKNIDGNLNLILTRGPGKMFKVRVPMDERFSEWIEEYFDAYREL